MTQAEQNLELVTRLFESGQVYERFNDIDGVDCDKTSDDLCRIVFEDGSAININPGDETVKATYGLDLDVLDQMTALINNENEVILAYQAKWSAEGWSVATKKQFMDNYDRDRILGVDGDALDESDEIICADGKILATEIL